MKSCLIGWIAPRGIVALTVSGYFATILLENGYKDAELLTALTFALVFSTVVLHGFSIGFLGEKVESHDDGRIRRTHRWGQRDLQRSLPNR